jgi:hypothetical protein
MVVEQGRMVKMEEEGSDDTMYMYMELTYSQSRQNVVRTPRVSPAIPG